MAALIHQDSPICVKSELDLFSIPSTQAAIEFGKFVEYFPLSNIRDGSPVEFHISGSGDEYLDLDDSYIHIKAKKKKNLSERLYLIMKPLLRLIRFVDWLASNTISSH
ncbi:hypothetical protein AVEN_78131-1 [Araneus ventricosus]|uniref:Uncharacterized protein n=1 Tax=Araneus ventricosus TaxID=182803 RepID=A0A4Y2KVV2_ARAVE|nr:hypothetical protein AVEN_78131-1 [Araneus ventricosus]